MNDDVRIWEEPLTIPTYPIGPAEACPMFYAGRGYQGAKGPVYPYPLMDRLADAPVERTYRAVWLENRYLRLGVLPEIGGRIFSGTDKTNGYDFIYRQRVVKPALIGMLGAWISGGVEWNIPHHHRPSTFMPADHLAVANADGSQTLWLGEIERRHRLKWIVGLTLRPDSSRLEVAIRIFNRTPYAHSFLCFTNLAVHVNDRYQVIFPPSTRLGTQHAKCEFIRWPVADGMYAGMDYAGVDVSWWKNHPGPLSIFACNDEDDFFGGYDHGAGSGIVHVADRRAVPGKKFFTFGNGPAGRMWDKVLTDADGPYLELMAGAYSDNQPDYSWIQPGETKTITECWYPVRQLGGIGQANREAASHLSVDNGVARLAFNTTAPVRAEARLEARGQVLLREEADIAPDRPWVRTAPLPPGVKPEELLAVLATPAGRELVACRLPPPQVVATPKPVEPPPEPKDIPDNESLYLAGLRLEQFHSPAKEPEPYYQEALRRDPGDARANTAMGILYCKRGLWPQAQERLVAAVARLTRNFTRPRDGQPLYYLALALKALGKRAEARDALAAAAWDLACRSAALCALAEMACQDGDWPSALSAVDESLAANARNSRALDLRAVVLRKAGRLAEAHEQTGQGLAIDPLDFWARNERLLCDRAAGQAEQARHEEEQLTALMRGEAQSYLELACDYEGCGLWDEAIGALERRLAGPSSGVDPTVHYALGYYWQRQGQAQQAAREFSLAAGMPPDFCFPFRMETAGWLRAALAANPGDARALYYLGNLLYDIQPGPAMTAWEQSRALDEGFWLVHRNLAFGHGRIEGERPKAVASLRRSMECNGQEPMLLLELDQLLEADGAAPEDRLALLERHSALAGQRDDLQLRLASVNVLVGRCERAIELLAGRHFHIWEGGEHTAHNVYVDAHLILGRRLLNAGRKESPSPHAAIADPRRGSLALAEFRQAAEYPDRFEVGEPCDGGRAPEVWYHIGLAHEALGQPDQARAAFEQAARRARKGTDLPYYQGLALLKLGQAAGAQTCFAELTRLGQAVLAGSESDFFEKFGVRRTDAAGRAQAMYLLGLGRLGQGDAPQPAGHGTPAVPGARRHFEEAARLNPNHLQVRVRLGRM